MVGMRALLLRPLAGGGCDLLGVAAQRWLRQGLVLAMLAPIVAPASAQEFSDLADSLLVRTNRYNWPRQLLPLTAQQHGYELSLRQRLRVESVSNNWRRGQTAGTNTQLASQVGLRLGARRGPWSGLVDMQDARNLGAGAGDFQRRMRNESDVLQVLLRWRLQDGRWGEWRDPAVHLGRMGYEVGHARLVGRNLYPNVTNTFDGVAASVGWGAYTRLRVFWLYPVDLGPQQTDRSDRDLRLQGLVLRQRRLGWQGELSWLDLQDSREQGRATQRDLQTWSLRLEQPPMRAACALGCWWGETELAYQHGRRQGREHVAHMGVAKWGYQWPGNRQWRAWLEVLEASGTRNPAAGKSGGFDRLFGLRRRDLMQTSLYGPFAQSNLQSVGWRLQWQPAPRTQAMFKHHANWLHRARGRLAVSSLAGLPPLQDTTGSAGRWLGHDAELILRHSPWPGLDLSAGLSYWWKGDYFRHLATQAGCGGVPEGGEQATHAVFLEVVYRI
jgi:hypothetical protein